MTEKKIVKFTVEIECYEETIKSAVTQYQLRQMMGKVSMRPPHRRGWDSKLPGDTWRG
ncbi:putative RNA triphosphatase [Pectobacterium phage PcCB7V]|nr:putative RNA triphosphatase [Pectobacterium phage PcCB7V]